MSLTQVGFLLIFVANVWAIYMMWTSWYGKKGTLVKYWYDASGDIQFGEEDNDSIK